MKFRIGLALVFLLAGSPAFPQDNSTPKKPGDRKGKVVSRADSGSRSAARSAPITVQGSVVTEEGNPLPSPVQVQIRCQGSLRQETYTTSDGHFSFTLGSFGPNNAGFDAGIGGTPGISAPPDLMGSNRNDPLRQAGVGRKLPFERADLSACHLEAVLAGYSSDKINLGIRSAFDQPDVGSLVVRKRENVKGGTISLNSLTAPPEALELLERARAEMFSPEPDFNKARKHLDDAVKLFPSFASAWQMIGESHLLEGNESPATLAFQKAIDSDPSFVSPLLALSELNLRAGRWREASDLAARALAVNPYVIPGQYCHAVARYYLGELDPALDSLDVILKSESAPLFPQSLYLRGMILAEKGAYTEALGDLGRFLETSPAAAVVNEIEANLRRWQEEGRISESQVRELLSPASPGAAPQEAGDSW